jgi:poly(ribitol-phosphate) beta-N-acetylglucosaminyltransferase
VAVKVSVVVPVYNPGSDIDELIASLLRQSLPAEEFETIFVDDGSTDGTPARLDAVAREHPHFGVIHIPNSGWPGRPRNVGIDAAQGKYVYFVDNDDWIGDEALERLYTMAERNGSDVVVGKMAGHERRVPFELFTASRDRVTLDDCPLLVTAAGGDPLMPHKLFRRTFLDEHGIRFPEGRRRLEDHVFVLNAYFRAKVISILADYVCYHWVRRETNASHAPFDHGYFENAREVLDLIERHTDAGPLRDQLLGAWYREKMLRRVGGSLLLRFPPDYRRELFGEIRRLALERFGPGVVQGLPARFRVRSALLRAGDLERLIALATVETAIKPAVRLEDLRWERGRLTVDVSGRLGHADGTPLGFPGDGERLYWDPPLDLGPEVTPQDRDVTSELESSAIEVFVRSRDERGDFSLPVESRAVRDEGGQAVTVSLVGKARLDPVTCAEGRPLGRETWDVLARVHTAGWAASARVGSDRSDTISTTLPPAFVGDPVHVVIPFWTRAGNLTVDVDQSSKPLRRLVTPRDADARSEGAAVAFTLALPALLDSSAPRAAELHAKRMGTTARTVTVPATISPSGSGDSSTRLDALLPFKRIFPTSGTISPGSWKLFATIGPATRSLGLLLDVAADGTVSVRSTRSAKGAPIGAPARLPERVLFDPSWRRGLRRFVRGGVHGALAARQRLHPRRVRLSLPGG